MAKKDKHVQLPKKDYKKGDLPDTKEEWVVYINRCHESGLASRRKFEFQWVLNLSHFNGYQNMIYNARKGTLELPGQHRNPLTINRIGSFIEARHAKITKNRPTPRVIPDTNTPEDIRGAENADKALLHLWRQIEVDNECDKLAFMMLINGTAFMSTLWDPRIGDVIKDYRKSSDGDDLMLDDDGVPIEDNVFMGNVSSRAKSAWSLVPANDSLVEIKDQEWLIDRSHMSVMEIESLYPELRGNITKEDREASYTEYEKIVQRLSSPVFHSTGQGSTMARDSLNSQALVKTYWQKPNYQYEQGVVAVVVGNDLAMIAKWPNDYGMKNIYPIVKFTEKVGGFHFWSQSTIERLIPPQKAYNKLQDQKARNAALMANIKWLVAKGSQLSEESLTDESGEVVEYNPAVPMPQPAQISPMPNYVSELARDLITDFRDVGGQREASVTPPPNITAGVAMQISAELSDEIIGPIIKRFGYGLSIVGNQQLLLMDQEWKEARKVKILGDSKVDVQWMSNVDFRHATDVHIEVESMFPEFRGSKRQTLLDLWDRRIVQDPQKILKAFKFGNWDYITDEDEKIEDSVVLDIAMIKKGKEPEINPFQNHVLYVKEMSKWVQTPEFLRLIPERKQLAIQVLQAHIGMIMQQMPNQGQPMAQTNPAAVNTPFGAQKPVGGG